MSETYIAMGIVCHQKFGAGTLCIHFCISGAGTAASQGDGTVADENGTMVR